MSLLDEFAGPFPLGLNADEIQIPYEKHHRVSSLITKGSCKLRVDAGGKD